MGKEENDYHESTTCGSVNANLRCLVIKLTSENRFKLLNRNLFTTSNRERITRIHAQGIKYEYNRSENKI